MHSLDREEQSFVLTDRALYALWFYLSTWGLRIFMHVHVERPKVGDSDFLQVRSSVGTTRALGFFMIEQ